MICQPTRLHFINALRLWEAEFKSFIYLVGRCQGSIAFFFFAVVWVPLAAFTKVYNINWGPENNSERSVIFIAVRRKNTVKVIKHSWNCKSYTKLFLLGSQFISSGFFFFSFFLYCQISNVNFEKSFSNTVNKKRSTWYLYYCKNAYKYKLRNMA